MRSVMRNLVRAAFVFGVVAVLGVEAQSQEIPNLVGTWKADATAVHVGSNPYRTPESNGPVFGDNVLEFTFEVKEQREGRFAGELSSGKTKETLIGALQPPDFKGGILLDNDGEYTFTLRDPQTIDVCYRHLLPTTKVVACYTLNKQP